jgi:hypothetical protein
VSAAQLAEQTGWREARRFRRVIDFFPPPSPESRYIDFSRAQSAHEIVMEIEGAMWTGVLKVTCEGARARAAALLFHGRVVGCVYASRSVEPQPTDPSLNDLLELLHFDSAEIECYTLDEDVVLSMSALFLGYPVERNDDLDARSYLDYIGSWLQHKEQTACIAITSSRHDTALAFVRHGRYTGLFQVDQQHFSTQIQVLFDLLNEERAADISASIFEEPSHRGFLMSARL